MAKKWTIAVISILVSLVVVVYAVVEKDLDAIGKGKDTFHIDENFLLGLGNDKASTTESKATSKVSCNKDQSLNLSLNSGNRVVDQQKVKCKQEEPGKSYQIGVETGSFEEAQGQAQNRGKNKNIAQQQAESLDEMQNGQPMQDHQIYNSQQTDKTVFGWGFDTTVTPPASTHPSKKGGGKNGGEVVVVSNTTNKNIQSSNLEKAKHYDKQPTTSLDKKPTTTKPTRSTDLSVSSKSGDEKGSSTQEDSERQDNDGLNVHIEAYQDDSKQQEQTSNDQQDQYDDQQSGDSESDNQGLTAGSQNNDQPMPQSETSKSITSFTFPGEEKFELNSQGEHVETLIKLLNASGYNTDEVNKFTSEVSVEVKKFQQDQGWSGKDADGIPGPGTWNNLVNNYKGGFPGDQYFRKGGQNNSFFVKKLEKRLKEKGLISTVTNSGKYTDEMKAAVKKFQEEQGWQGTDADGYPGKETWKRLMS